MTVQRTFDCRPELRELIHEHLGFLLLHAECGQRYAAAGDDHAPEYSVRQVIARSKFIGSSFIDIQKFYSSISRAPNA